MSESAEGQPSGQSSAETPRLVLAMRGGATCELRADRVVVNSAAGAQEYPLADIAWAGLVIDPSVAPVPGAPPAPAVLLRLRDARDVVLSPAEPPAAWQLLGAIFAARPDLRPAAAGAYPPRPPGAGYGPSYAYGPGYGAGYAPGYPYPPRPSGSNSDTVLAGLSHLSVFFAPVILPLIVWLTTRASAPYTSNQAKQAFFFHLVFWILSIVGVVGYIILLFGSFAAFATGSGSFDPSSGSDPFTFLPILLIFGFYAIFGLLWLVQVIFSIIGAVNAFQGKPFHYPLLGWL